jgi:histone H2B
MKRIKNLKRSFNFIHDMLARITGIIKPSGIGMSKRDQLVSTPILHDGRDEEGKKSTSIESIEKMNSAVSTHETGGKAVSKRKPVRSVPYTKKPRTWNTYLYRCLKSIHPDTGITKKSMAILNDLVDDLFERIMNEASELARKDQRHTLTTREIQSAVRLVLPGELARHAVSEGHAAFVKYLENTKKAQ